MGKTLVVGESGCSKCPACVSRLRAKVAIILVVIDYGGNAGRLTMACATVVFPEPSRDDADDEGPVGSGAIAAHLSARHEVDAHSYILRLAGVHPDRWRRASNTDSRTLDHRLRPVSSTSLHDATRTIVSLCAPRAPPARLTVRHGLGGSGLAGVPSLGYHEVDPGVS